MKFLLIFLFIFIALILIYAALLFKNAGPIKTFGGKRPVEFLQNKSLYFFPHFIYGITASVNTYFAFTVGKIKKFKAKNREKIIGYDGGEFSVDWFSCDTDSCDTVPIIVLLHGLNGGSSEPCITSLGVRLSKMGWKACCILFRGCGGTKLTTLRSYNGGYTEDLHFFLEHLLKKYPNAPVGIVGFSLGGNVLIKYLGERNSVNQPLLKFQHIVNKLPIPRNVIAAVSVCPPHDYWKIDEIMPETKYDKIVGKGMLYYCKKHEYMLSQIPTYQNLKDWHGDIHPKVVDQNMNMHVFHYKTVKEFYVDCGDERYIDGVGLHGFRSPGSVSASASASGTGTGTSSADKADDNGKGKVNDEHIPLLIIAAKNDPLSLELAIPYKKIEKNPDVGLLLYPGGAHLGFFSYFSNRRRDHDVIIRYFHYELLGLA